MKFTPAEKQKVIPQIQAYFQKELDQEIGPFDAEFLLDFFADKIGAFFYNRAISDVHAHLESQVESMVNDIHSLEKPTSFHKL